MRPSRLGMPPPVAERIELLDIAEIEPGLPLHPFAQADLQRAMGARRKRAERKRVPRVSSYYAGPHDEDVGLPFAHRDDGGVQAKLDLRVGASRFVRDRSFASCFSHGGLQAARSADNANTSASSATLPRPISSTAAIMRPLRDSASSASATRRRLG